MSRITHMTSVRTLTFREEQEQKRNIIKVKTFSVMGVKDLDTLEQNALHISRNKKMGYLSLGLMMITLKVNLTMNLLNM